MKPLAVLLSSFCLCHSSFAAGRQPNVLFILADDLGWNDTTLFGTTKFYQTPNVERLAMRGVTFIQAYSASPLCSPSRSAILTGLSPARTGITSPNCHLPEVVLEATPGKKAAPDQKATQPSPVTRLKTGYHTLSKSLKAAGYATGHFGKWHLGPDPYSPLQQGFDVDVPHHSGPGPAGSYVAPWKFKNFDADPGEPNQHIEDRMAKEAVAFMEKHRDEPFYLNYWMFSVHAPFDAKKSLIGKHRARVNPTDPQRSPTYAAMVESMDDAIGTLLDTLDRLRIADNTIIIFTSDNGGNMYNEVDGTTPTSNAPLRGGKATMFEGGTRVPCVVVWPGITTAGTRSGAIVQCEDYYPTLLSGLSIKPATSQKFDGASILPALQGDPLDGKTVFQYFPHNPGVPDWLPPAVSVHRGDWKLIRIFHGGEMGAHRYLLFNLRDDLSEQTNLAARKPELVTVLLITLASLHAADPLAESKPVVPAKPGSNQETTVPREPAPFTPAADLQGAWSFTADPKLPNVLILGDSISIAYTRMAREKLTGKANVYRPMRGKGPDNCGDTTIGLNKIDGWLGQQKWDVIHFNWGLWDLCYRNPQSKAQGNRDKAGGKLSTTPADYEKNLERLVNRLEATGAKLIWANTTVVPEGEVGRFVGDDAKYNAIAARVMKQHRIATDDLFTLTQRFAGKFSVKAGDVHFTNDGSEKLAAQVAATIEKALPEMTSP